MAIPMARGILYHLDTGKCDGCGKCVEACPAAVLEIQPNSAGKPKAVVKETLRKKIHLVCPGNKACSASHPV